MNLFDSLYKKFFSSDSEVGISNENGVSDEIRRYDIEERGFKSRIHLRENLDGSGILLVNASRIMHLNPTAVEMAKLYLDKMPIETAIVELEKSYSVSRQKLKEDYQELIGQLEELINPNGACPICDLNLDTLPPFSAIPSAPYRMDLAVTYRCNNDCAHCYNDRPRNHPELTTDQWKSILQALWEIGIPHIVFTGGEPTLREDLPELIQFAENLGQITGINTNGRRLKDSNYVERLKDAGLDHIQITLESADPKIHDAIVRRQGAWLETIQGIENALKSSLFVMTNSTLLQPNIQTLIGLLNFLSEKGVPTVGLNALIYSGKGADCNTGLLESELPAYLEKARDFTSSHNQRLIWYTPTQYCHFDPKLMDLGVKGCTAALYNMCVESDGSVIPCQSYYFPLGNLLKDSWDDIWNHPLAVGLRERHNLPEECNQCSFVKECGGGCPLARMVKQIDHPKAIRPYSYIMGGNY